MSKNQIEKIMAEIYERFPVWRDEDRCEGTAVHSIIRLHSKPDEKLVGWMIKRIIDQASEDVVTIQNFDLKSSPYITISEAGLNKILNEELFGVQPAKQSEPEPAEAAGKCQYCPPMKCQACPSFAKFGAAPSARETLKELRDYYSELYTKTTQEVWRIKEVQQAMELLYAHFIHKINEVLEGLLATETSLKINNPDGIGKLFRTQEILDDDTAPKSDYVRKAIIEAIEYPPKCAECDSDLINISDKPDEWICPQELYACISKGQTYRGLLSCERKGAGSNKQLLADIRREHKSGTITTDEAIANLERMAVAIRRMEEKMNRAKRKTEKKEDK